MDSSFANFFVIFRLAVRSVLGTMAMDRADRQSALLRLLALALSDGTLQNEEEIFLLEVAERYGLSKGEIFQVLLQKNVEAMKLPESIEDRFDHLVDLAVMMLMDQQMTNSEKRLFYLLGRYLGFSSQALERVVMVVREEMRQAIDLLSLKQHIRQMLPLLVN